VVQEELHHLRSYLTNCLAQNLDQRLEALLQSVLNELHQRILSGPLSKLVPPPDDKPQSTRRRIDAFRQLLKPDTQQHILGGIDYLLSFTFSYLSHFHYRVREAMDQLDPMGHSNPIGRIVPHDAAARSAEDVLRGLDVVYHEVVFQVRRRLSAKELSGDPMRAVFALVEEVKDQLTRGKDVEVEWQEFLNARRAEIWPDQFRPFAVASACRREWELAIECARGASGQLRAAFPN
jgi:hypothetical protein